MGCMTDNTEEKTIDAATVAQLLAWQVNGEVLGLTAFDTFLELLGEARNTARGTTRLETDFGLDEAGTLVAGLTNGRFGFYLETNPDINGLPRKTTVRTSKGELSFDGEVQMTLCPPLWSSGDDDDMTPEQMRLVSEMFKGLAAGIQKERRSGGSESE